MADEQTLVQVVPPDSLIGKRSQQGRNYWKATDPNGTVWTIWDAQLALLYTQLYGQQALWHVRISPASDPRYGMNYELRSLQAVNGGGNIQQGTVAQIPATPGGGVVGLPQAQPSPQLPQASPQPSVSAPGIAQLPSPPQQTLGQGGNFSDSDIIRMARSTAIEAVSRFALVFPDEFKNSQGVLDWAKLYIAAESLAKFVTHRRHEGWIPGVELAPNVTNEERVIAEVNAEFPGAVTKGLPEVPEDADIGSAENATGGEVDWE